MIHETFLSIGNSSFSSLKLLAITTMINCWVSRAVELPTFLLMISWSTPRELQDYVDLAMNLSVSYISTSDHLMITHEDAFLFSTILGFGFSLQRAFLVASRALDVTLVEIQAEQLVDIWTLEDIDESDTGQSWLHVTHFTKEMTGGESDQMVKELANLLSLSKLKNVSIASQAGRSLPRSEEMKCVVLSVLNGLLLASVDLASVQYAESFLSKVPEVCLSVFTDCALTSLKDARNTEDSLMLGHFSQVELDQLMSVGCALIRGKLDGQLILIEATKIGIADFNVWSEREVPFGIPERVQARKEQILEIMDEDYAFLLVIAIGSFMN
jgi:hypothetical protein